ncbi:MAG: DUF4982 domain-containing protein, partial [Chitinivibrionales bacterium]|nr:DUF4982 domain-containing protein [Chitinivibrionales bacterium]
WSTPGPKPVWAYSNCDSVELFNDLGTISFGKRARTGGERGDTRFQWDDPFVRYNVLYARGYIDGKVAAEDTIVLQNLADPPTGTVLVETASQNAPQVQFSLRNGETTLRLTAGHGSNVNLALYALDGSKVLEIENVRAEASGIVAQLSAEMLTSGTYLCKGTVGTTWISQMITVHR